MERFARLLEGGADPERVAFVVGIQAREGRRPRHPAGADPRLAPQPARPDDPRAGLRRGHGAAGRPRLRRAAGDPVGGGSVRQGARAPGRPGPAAVAGVRPDAPAARLRRRDATVPLPRAGVAPHTRADRCGRRGARAHRLARARRVPPRVPGGDRRPERRGLRRHAPARGAGGGEGRDPVRPRPRRRPPGQHARRRGAPAGTAGAGPRRGRRPRGPRLRLPGDDRRPDPSIHRTVRGRARPARDRATARRRPSPSRRGAPRTSRRSTPPWRASCGGSTWTRPCRGAISRWSSAGRARIWPGSCARSTMHAFLARSPRAAWRSGPSPPPIRTSSRCAGSRARPSARS